MMAISQKLTLTGIHSNSFLPLEMQYLESQKNAVFKFEIKSIFHFSFASTKSLTART
jgi:hypothetical protein